MRTVNVKVGSVIFLGRQGENAASNIVFDIKEFKDLYGDGTVTLLNQRNGEVTSYVCDLILDENEEDHVIWSPTSFDTSKPGYGKCQLVWQVDESISKSAVWTTVVGSSLLVNNV